MYRVVITMLSCLLMAITYSVEADATSQQWKIGHIRPSGSAIDKSIQQFVEQINVETNGAIQIKIYPNSKLGDYSVVQERVSFGEVDMFVGPLGTTLDKRVAIAFTPFLVSTWAEAKQVYFQGSALFNKVAEYLEVQNIKLVGGWPVYFGGIALITKPVQPGNPDILKDMIIRVPPVRSFERTARALGYTPYPITWTYAKMGLKTGMVDGLIGAGAEGYFGLKGVVKYYLPIRDHFEYWFVYMNLDLWNSLSEKKKTLLSNLSREMEIKRYAVAEAEERDSIDKLEKIGVEIINIDEKEHALMKEKVRKMVWPEMRKEIGEDFDIIVK